MKEEHNMAMYLFTFMYALFLGFLIGSIFGLSNGVKHIQDLGHAICDQKEPKHTLEFDHYENKVVYCKEKPKETSYDGLKIRIGDSP